MLEVSSVLNTCSTLLTVFQGTCVCYRCRSPQCLPVSKKWLWLGP